MRLKPKSRNYFFSYQCDKDEIPDHVQLLHVSVLFFDNYIPTTDLKNYEAEVVCPLNGSTDVRNTCERCRRCFDGKAVKHSKNVNGHEQGSRTLKAENSKTGK